MEYKTLDANELSSLPSITPEMFSSDPLNIKLKDIEACVSYAKKYYVTIMARGHYTLAAGTTLTLDSVKWMGGGFSGKGTVFLNNAALDGADISGVMLQITGGSCSITNNKIHNQTTNAALFIDKLENSAQLVCSHNEFYSCNYSILHQGTISAGDPAIYLDSAIISHNNFHDTKGDAIELNLVNNHYKKGLLIESNIILNIDGTQLNWGIGIGISGTGPYSLNAAENSYAANFTIQNNYISGCRQCIHTEMCRDFNIINNICYPDPTKSTSTGIITGAYVAYGCKRFVVNGLNGEPTAPSSRFIMLSWGVNGDDYACPPTFFTVKNINTINGHLEIYTAGADDWQNTTIIENIRCNKFLWRGLPAISIFRSIYCMSIDFIGRHASDEGVGGGKYIRGSATYSHWADVLCLNLSFLNAKVSKLIVDKLITNGNNFPVLMSEDPVKGARGPILSSSMEQYYLPDDTFPQGREFVQGAILWKKSGGYFLVTKAGASITGKDLIGPLNAGDTRLYSVSYPWSAPEHLKNAGTYLLIKGAGNGGKDLTAVITRGTYIANGKYSVDISPAVSTSVPNSLQLVAANPIEYVEMS